MRVELNIKNDEELRDYIKEAINGQVLAIVRDDVFNTVKAELHRKINLMSGDSIVNLMSSAARVVIKDILYKHFGVSEWDKTFIKPFVESIVEQNIGNTNWDKLIEDMAKDKIKKMIQ